LAFWNARSGNLYRVTDRYRLTVVVVVVVVVLLLLQH
jgi:hypothetical protein